MHSRPWLPWHRHFAARARRARPQIGAAPLLPEPRRRTLAASLAVFQLGEAGEGRIAHQIDRCGLACVDGDYRAALKLFVAEEARHAAILGDLVRSVGGRLLRKSWTEGLFRFGRRSMGVRLKLLVLLAAEVIGVSFYGLLAARLPEGPARAALDQICGDEEDHLAFHAAFFRAALPGRTGRAAFGLAWWTVGLAACAVVAADHRRTLRAFEVPVGMLVRTCLGALARAHAAVLAPAAADGSHPVALAA